ncbi:MAG: hypothetical protein ABJA60_06450 [Nitrosospira sp.]
MSGEGDPIHQIIEEVAVKHGYALDRDDPVLMLYTINRRLMQSSAAIQQTMLEQHGKELDVSMRKWEIQASRQADSAMFGKLDAMQDVIAMTVRTEFEAALKELKMDLQRYQRSTHINLLASLLALAAAAIVLMIVLPF